MRSSYEDGWAVPMAGWALMEPASSPLCRRVTVDATSRLRRGMREACSRQPRRGAPAK